ncbi:GGDEF domain-containing protein [Methylorubrum sp. SB2]|uniref:GGDEF domain-containing protein n=1 Tax=Methylorubrum subtropicum TaxID=3138812 RepID=UPI00313DD003
MPAPTVRRTYDLGGKPLLDRWLRLAPPIQDRYDAEHAGRRRAELRAAILVGIALYNIYNFTSLVLLPDVLWLSVALRVGLVTPVSLGLAWVIGRTSPLWTERLVLAGILNAYLIPVSLFWLTQDPLGLFTFGELSLTIVFADMLLALRFRHAVVFTGSALAITLLAVATKADLAPALQIAFAVQFATACIFSLYANHVIERRRCRDYIATLDASLEARSADAARREFENLSHTDALTGLPNRRHLAETLETWLSRPDAMALMMIDIDHFKLYNDALGHPAGDDCLRRIAETFADFARRHDAFCARFGGEEFTVLIRDGASELALARCARQLGKAVEALAIVHPARADGPGIATISIGVARRPEGAAIPAADLIAAADRALYAAKRRGRNGFAFGEDRPAFAAEA